MIERRRNGGFGVQWRGCWVVALVVFECGDGVGCNGHGRLIWGRGG